jgi:hypothetical protein
MLVSSHYVCRWPARLLERQTNGEALALSFAVSDQGSSYYGNEATWMPPQAITWSPL